MIKKQTMMTLILKKSLLKDGEFEFKHLLMGPATPN
jgi:hypothetical protein